MPNSIESARRWHAPTGGGSTTCYDGSILESIKRWIPASSMLLVSLISYIDRNTLALLAPTILKENHLSAGQYGFIISAFSILYMIGNPVWGRLIDRFGLRRGMTASVSMWTLASAAHAVAGGFAGLAAARAALGFGEGATFPGGLRTVVQTLPPSQRSRGIAVAYSGGSLGSIITPLVVTPIAVWWGWRAAFLFTGLIGAMWLVMWAFVSRHPGIREKREHESERPRVRFADPRVWAFMLLYAFGALPLAFVIYGAAIYLSQVMGRSQADIGKVLWIPPVGWEAGYFFWGTISDRLAARGRLNLPSFRSLLVILAALSLPLAAAPWGRSYPLLLAQLFLAMFVAAGFIILSVAYATHTYSAGYAGLIAGLGAGAWSAAVALIMPVFGRLFDLRMYTAAFALAALCPMLGFLSWWLGATRGELPAARSSAR
jgi:ACS family hexuronate transporter-like MFS transporter